MRSPIAAGLAASEGGLSDRARKRALDIAQDADLRIQGPPQFFSELEATLGPAWSAPHPFACGVCPGRSVKAGR